MACGINARTAVRPAHKKISRKISINVPSANTMSALGPKEYFELIFDEGYVRLFDDLISYDFMNFTDLKPYGERLEEARKKTGMDEAIAVAAGTVEDQPFVVAAMDFRFIGGSMGSVVGEKISRAIDYCMEYKGSVNDHLPLRWCKNDGGSLLTDADG
jgi:acetyl-CoA carboxylase beta subunit